MLASGNPVNLQLKMKMSKTNPLTEEEKTCQLTLGAFLKPLMLLKTDPPIAPIVKAPPQSPTIRQGLKNWQKIQIKHS
jgi:hypothetical protein